MTNENAINMFLFYMGTLCTCALVSTYIYVIEYHENYR